MLVNYSSVKCWRRYHQCWLNFHLCWRKYHLWWLYFHLCWLKSCLWWQLSTNIGKNIICAGYIFICGGKNICVGYIFVCVGENLICVGYTFVCVGENIICVTTFSSVLAKISSMLAIFLYLLVENYVYCNSPTQMFPIKTTPLVALILFCRY